MAATEVSDKQPQNKRKANTSKIAGANRPVKRRASKACCCCRSRKVRCDVVESGAPCTNCRLDEVECVVTESKRRKKTRTEGELSHPSPENSADTSDDSGPRFTVNGDMFAPVSPSQQSVDLEHTHVPHLIYQSESQRMSHGHCQRRMSSVAGVSASYPLSNLTQTAQQLLGSTMGQPLPSPVSNSSRNSLPNYIRPLPPKFMSEDIDYLRAKGALTVPEPELRNELMKSYVLYVHTYMPLLELDEFLRTIVRNDSSRQLSLLLFQAVMFAGTAFIPMRHLQAAGFESRKVARKTFFQRARLLYDFDYEIDRMALVQSLLLMTHWYEMPDDQKDTWHWMGVSLSLAHTIGLHRDPSNSNMHPQRQKMWKRIWWSTYTRDRLIALGMRRPTRVKDEDCDVPMLTVDDFDIRPFSPEALQIIGSCPVAHNLNQQRDLAVMFIEKSKLCLCISRVLSAQYSVLSHKFGGTTETTMMLVPKKSTAETCEVSNCDQELEHWFNNLPEEAQYRPAVTPTLENGEDILHLHRALLKMEYLTTSSALHRPQVLPATPYPTVEAELQELSRTKVRHAAVEITSIAQDLHSFDLTRYLPTTGVTVILPAVIIHLLDVKSNDPSVRSASLNRFYQCMQILQRLREIYASADFATSFLEAAIRKAGIQISTQVPQNNTQNRPSNPNIAKARANALTPPPDSGEKIPEFTYPNPTVSSPSVTLSRGENPDLLFASTPPNSASSENGSTTNVNIFNTDMFSNTTGNADPSLKQFMNMAHDADITQNDLDALINFDDAGADLFASQEGFDLDIDMDPLKNVNNEPTLDWMGEFSTNNDQAGGENNHDIDLDGASIKLGQGQPVQNDDLEKALESPQLAPQPDAVDLSKPRGVSITGDLDADIGL